MLLLLIFPCLLLPTLASISKEDGLSIDRTVRDAVASAAADIQDYQACRGAYLKFYATPLEFRRINAELEYGSDVRFNNSEEIMPFLSKNYPATHNYLKSKLDMLRRELNKADLWEEADEFIGTIFNAAADFLVDVSIVPSNITKEKRSYKITRDFLKQMKKVSSIYESLNPESQNDLERFGCVGSIVVSLKDSLLVPSLASLNFEQTHLLTKKFGLQFYSSVFAEIAMTEAEELDRSPQEHSDICTAAYSRYPLTRVEEERRRIEWSTIDLEEVRFNSTDEIIPFLSQRLPGIYDMLMLRNDIFKEEISQKGDMHPSTDTFISMVFDEAAQVVVEFSQIRPQGPQFPRDATPLIGNMIKKVLAKYESLLPEEKLELERFTCARTMFTLLDNHVDNQIKEAKSRILYKSVINTPLNFEKTHVLMKKFGITFNASALEEIVKSEAKGILRSPQEHVDKCTAAYSRYPLTRVEEERRRIEWSSNHLEEVNFNSTDEITPFLSKHFPGTYDMLMTRKEIFREESAKDRFEHFTDNTVSLIRLVFDEAAQLLVNLSQVRSQGPQFSRDVAPLIGKMLKKVLPLYRGLRDYETFNLERFTCARTIFTILANSDILDGFPMDIIQSAMN